MPASKAVRMRWFCRRVRSAITLREQAGMASSVMSQFLRFMAVHALERRFVWPPLMSAYFAVLVDVRLR